MLWRMPICSYTCIVCTQEVISILKKLTRALNVQVCDVSESSHVLHCTHTNVVLASNSETADEINAARGIYYGSITTAKWTCSMYAPDFTVMVFML